MKVIYLAINLFVASAWGYELEIYKKTESTYTHQLRDVETQAPVPDVPFKRVIYSAVFNDADVIFTFDIKKVLPTDNIAFCEMSTDVFSTRSEERATDHTLTTRLFQMKAGHLLEKFVTSTFVNFLDAEGRLKTIFTGYPEDAHALAIRQANEDGTGWSEKSYYNMKQVVDDSIVDYENIKSTWKTMDQKTFFTLIPPAVRRFLLRFSEVHRSAAMLHESFKKCEADTPSNCGDLKKRVEESSRLRDQTWASFSSNDAFSLRPVIPVMRPRTAAPPPPPPSGYFGRFFPR